MTPFFVNRPKADKIALRVQRRGAFTLVEVLLVVAVLGMAAFAFIGGASDLFRAKEPRPDDVFWQGVTAARQLALESDQTVTFQYDQEKHTLAWTTAASPGGSLVFPGRLLEFLPVTQQGLVLIGGRLTETESIKFVRFYPDGGCDAFRAQLTDAGGRLTVMAIDPWTCAPMLAALPK